MVTNREGDELVEAIRPSGGGFTHNTKTGEPFKGRSGFAVSIRGAEQEHPAGEDVTREHIQHYADVHQSFLRKAGHYLGGWHSDRPPNSRFLDVSRIFQKKGRAGMAMVANDQRAMMNMKDYSETHNPYRQQHEAGLMSERQYGGLQAEAQKRLDQPRPASGQTKPGSRMWGH